MELLIVADLEGISGISYRDICSPTHPEYPAALAAYRAELDAVREVARARGIETVGLLDWHQRSLPADRFPEVVTPEQVLAERRPRAAVLLGFHARAGQPDAFAPATLVPGLRLFWEEREAGELALASRWLGEMGIPLLLVTGDRGLTLEAEEWTDQTATVAVKRAVAPDRAEVLPPERAHQAIAETLRRVLERRSWWWVYRPSLPVTIRVQAPDARQWAYVGGSMRELFDRLSDFLDAYGGAGLPRLAP